MRRCWPGWRCGAWCVGVGLVGGDFVFVAAGWCH